MATTPKLVGPADPALINSFENQTPSVARTSPPTLSANGTATSPGGRAPRSIAPRTSGDTTVYNQATQASSGTELFIVSSNSNDSNDIVTVYNTEKQISVSAVNQTINNYKITNNGAYGNSNVAAFLPTYDGNLSSGNLVVSGVSDLGSVSNVRIQGGTAGQVLSTNGLGALVWSNDVNVPGGSNTQIQFNDAGAFGGNTGFTFNKTTGTLAAPFADVSGVANIVGGGATVATKSVLNVASTFGSNDANDPASAQAVRGRVTGSNLTKTRNYVTGVTGQYLVTGTNASEFIKAGVLGVVGDQTTTADGAVVAYLDGDGGLTTANAAYAVSMKNSTPGSGFDYGLDLQFIDLNVAGTTTPFKQADIRFNNGVTLVANTANNVSINANVTVGNIIATNIGNIANINLDGSNSNVLYGNGVFAPASGGGANTGNWAFDDNTMYNMAGGEINNGDPTHGATAGLILPNNGNTGAGASLFNTYGNIQVSVANLANTANTSTWTFDNTGNLNTAGDLVGPANANFTIYSNAAAHEFTFGDDGTFYAPDNVVLGGNAIYIGPGANTLTGIEHEVFIASSNHFAYIQGVINNVSDNGSAEWVALGAKGDDSGGWGEVGFTSASFGDANYTITGAGDGYVFAQAYAPGSLAPAVGGGNLVLATGNQGTTKDIIFGTGGFLTGNIFGRISDANNELELSRANSNINLSGGGSIIGAGNLKLAPDSTNAASYLDIFLTSGPDLHLVASNGANLILGEDNGANVMASWNGDVAIQSWDTSTGNVGGVWTFGGNGKLTFPGTPRIDTATNNFEVQAAEAINFEANAAVNIYTDAGNNAYQWNFGGDGKTTLPTISLGSGINEQTVIQSQRKIIPSNRYSAVISGSTPTLVYTANDSLTNSMKVTLQLQHQNLGMEFFEVYATQSSNNTYYTVSNRLQPPTISNSTVLVDLNGSNEMQITVTVNSGATTSWVTYDSTEFGIPQD